MIGFWLLVLFTVIKFGIVIVDVSVIDLFEIVDAAFVTTLFSVVGRMPRSIVNN